MCVCVRACVCGVCVRGLIEKEKKKKRVCRSCNSTDVRNGGIVDI